MDRQTGAGRGDASRSDACAGDASGESRGSSHGRQEAVVFPTICDNKNRGIAPAIFFLPGFLLLLVFSFVAVIVTNIPLVLADIPAVSVNVAFAGANVTVVAIAVVAFGGQVLFSGGAIGFVLGNVSALLG